MEQVGQTRRGRLGDQPPPSAQAAGLGAAAARDTPQQEVQQAIQSNRVVVFSKLVCPK